METTKPAIYSLTCGAVETLYIFLQQPDTSKNRKQMRCAGELTQRLEPTVDSAPEPCLVSSDSPAYMAAAYAAGKAKRQWERKGAPALELSDAEFQVCIARIKDMTESKTPSPNQFLAELLVAFRLTE